MKVVSLLRSLRNPLLFNQQHSTGLKSSFPIWITSSTIVYVVDLLIRPNIQFCSWNFCAIWFHEHLWPSLQEFRLLRVWGCVHAEIFVTGMAVTFSILLYLLISFQSTKHSDSTNINIYFNSLNVGQSY